MHYGKCQAVPFLRVCSRFLSGNGMQFRSLDYMGGLYQVVLTRVLTLGQFILAKFMVYYPVLHEFGVPELCMEII